MNQGEQLNTFPKKAGSAITAILEKTFDAGKTAKDFLGANMPEIRNVAEHVRDRLSQGRNQLGIIAEKTFTPEARAKAGEVADKAMTGGTQLVSKARTGINSLAQRVANFTAQERDNKEIVN